MKEFSAQTGGRYTYVDDIVNLQELALAFSGIFDECDNFIISGCKVSDTNISSGYVYINGKLRYFSGVSGITSWPQYIYETNRSESIAYADGADKVGRNVYECVIGQSVPTVLDPLTGAVPAYIKITESGGLSLKDALFGRYSLLLQSAGGSQTVAGAVNFINDVNINGALNAKGRVNVLQGNCVGQIYYENNKLTVQSRESNGNIYKFVISEDSGFQFTVNNTIVFSVSDAECFFNLPIKVPEDHAGSTVMKNDNIYNSETAADTGSLYVNTKGYQGGASFYRDTHIGNGKGFVIMSVIGKTGIVNVNTQLLLASAFPESFILKSNLSKSDLGLCKIISWKDSGSLSIGHIGYDSTADNIFRIHNSLDDIQISGLSAVDLCPAIKENGVLLSSKYATVASLNGLLGGKSNVADVYTKTYTDQNFASLQNGLAQFVNINKTKQQLRSEIDALAMADLSGKYAEISNLLSDVATTEEKKQQICDNIGAARTGSFQPVLRDTGWIKIINDVYVRQIGNIVSIQGALITIHSGDVFVLPNTIDPPRYDVVFRAIMASNGDWGCRILGGSKTCQVVYCNSHGGVISFSMTYMT
jgi:hypothetical protein